MAVALVINDDIFTESVYFLRKIIQKTKLIQNYQAYAFITYKNCALLDSPIVCMPISRYMVCRWPNVNDKLLVQTFSRSLTKAAITLFTKLEI